MPRAFLIHQKTKAKKAKADSTLPDLDVPQYRKLDTVKDIETAVEEHERHLREDITRMASKGK